MASIGNATHFHVVGVDPGWGPNLMRVAQVGLHVFYRFGGHAGRPGSFNGQPQHSPAGGADDAGLPNADGAATGQFILASATTVAPASSPVPAAASASGAAKPAAATAPHPKEAAADKPELAPKTSAPEPAAASHPASVS
jgi:hypothetical protein